MKKKGVKELLEKREKALNENVHRRKIIAESILAGLLIISLVLERFAGMIPHVTTGIIAFFMVVKIYEVVKREGTIFEEYASIIGILIFGLVHFFTHNTANLVLIIAAVFILLYSMGTIIRLKELLRSKNIVTFILSYTAFIMAIIFLFSGAYLTNDSMFTENGREKTLTFEETVYFSIITFTTVGYGDISPRGINRIIASIESLIGVILNIAFVGYMLATSRFRKHS